MLRRTRKNNDTTFPLNWIRCLKTRSEKIHKTWQEPEYRSNMLRHYVPLIMLIRFNALIPVHEKVREFTVCSQGADGVSMTTRRMALDASEEWDRRGKNSKAFSGCRLGSPASDRMCISVKTYVFHILTYFPHKTSKINKHMRESTTNIIEHCGQVVNISAS